VLSIVDQKQISSTKFEIKTYAVNPDGSKGVLQSHVIQETFNGDYSLAATALGSVSYNSGGYVAVTDYKVTNGVSSCDTQCIVNSIVDQVAVPQNLLRPGTLAGFDIFSYNFDASGNKTTLKLYTRQETSTDGTSVFVTQYQVDALGNIVLETVCQPDDDTDCTSRPKQL